MKQEFTPDGRRKYINDALSKFKWNPNNVVLNPMDELMDRTKKMTDRIRLHMKPILKAGGWKDKDACRETVFKLYFEELSRFPKDELVVICAILHLEIMMETIESAPWGDDKPDLLSGV